MKNLFLLLVILSFLSCDDPKYNDLLPNTQVDVLIDLNLPLYIDLQVPGSWAETPTTPGYGIKGILIYNKNNTYIAFERACPHIAVTDCSQMNFDGLYLNCPCDDSNFNIFNGGVSTSGNGYSAREYLVQVISSTSLRITNY